MSMVSVDDLAAHMQVAITGAFTAMAQAALDDADGVVVAYCERIDDPWTSLTIPAGVALVVKRLAARLFNNPKQSTSYSGPEGLAFTGGPVRLLTDDERETLNAFKSSTKHVGMIRMTAAPWVVPQ